MSTIEPLETFEDGYMRMDRRMAEYVVKWNEVKDQRLYDLISARVFEAMDEAVKTNERMINVIGNTEEDSGVEEGHLVPLNLPRKINAYLLVPLNLPRKINAYLDELGVPDVPKSAT